MRPDPKFPSTQHYKVLAGWVREEGWERGAEIGVLKGKALFYVLDACPGLQMIGIDAWQYREPSDDPGSETYRAHNLVACAALVKATATKYGDRCQILHMDQHDAARQVEDGSLDFAFLDGNHTEAGTLAQIEAWRAKIRSGGYLCGHDHNWPSVQRALDAQLPGWERHPEHVWRWPV